MSAYALCGKWLKDRKGRTLSKDEKNTLKPVNPNFKPIILTGVNEGELQVVAEFVEVMGRES